MLPLSVFYTLLGLCVTYALVRGGQPERIGAAVLVVASLMSTAFVSVGPSRFRGVETGVLLVDVAAFAAFTVLALRADRFWPMWVSALLGLGILGHLGRMYLGPDLGGRAYFISLVIWSYPILAIVAIGTFNHQRRTAAHAGGLAADR